MKNAIKEIQYRLQRKNVNFSMNQYVFNLFNKVYGLKDNEKYCYVHRQYKNPTYTYSIQAIDLIVEEILKDKENIIGKLKIALEKTKKNSK